MGSAARGAALVGFAVVLGIILLQVIDDGPSSGTGGITGDSTVTTAATVAPTDSTAAAATHPRDQVNVVVLNGSDQSNVASVKRNALVSLGYQVEPAENTQLRQGNVVACKAGFEGDAERLSTDAGSSAAPFEIIPFPDPAPTGREGQDVGAGNANCVVILGTA